MAVFGLPNPLSVLGSNVAGGVLSGVFSGLGSLVVGWLASAAGSAFNVVAGLVNGSAGSISMGPTSWWATKAGGLSPVGTGLYPTIISVALVVLLACLLLAVIQGALAGDAASMLRALGREMPMAIFGMVTVVAFTEVLSRVTDAASVAVLPQLGPSFGAWFAHAPDGGLFTGGFVMVLMLLGALALWVELVVRQGLVFVLLALAPMALAVRVWPSARGVWRRLCELGLALIVSKFVIAVALALGSDALAGSVTAGSSVTAGATGAGLMLVAAFSPFVLLRLVPMVEGALVGQGISRMPLRAAQSGLSTSYSLSMLAAGRARTASRLGTAAAAGGADTAPGPAAGPGAGPSGGPGPGRSGPTGGPNGAGLGGAGPSSGTAAPNRPSGVAPASAETAAGPAAEDTPAPAGPAAPGSARPPSASTGAAQAASGRADTRPRRAQPGQTTERRSQEPGTGT